MAGSVTNAFEKKYSDDVTHLASQMKSKLVDRVRTHRNVIGSTYDFHRMAGVAAASRASGSSAEVTGLDPVQSVATATLTDWEVPIYAQKFDQLKTSTAQIEEYQKETVAAMNRKFDDVIIAALVAGATTTSTTQTGGLTYAKLLELQAYFLANDVDPEDRTLLISPQAMVDALGIQQLTSGDYMQIGAILNAGIGNALGMKWIVSSRLPKTGNNRSNFAFDRSAVGLAIGMDVRTEINYVPQRVSHLINTMGSLGAVVIDPLHVIKMITVEA